MSERLIFVLLVAGPGTIIGFIVGCFRARGMRGRWWFKVVFDKTMAGICWGVLTAAVLCLIILGFSEMM